MDRTLTNFIRALRASDIPVSTAEAIDAAGAAKLIGYDDRTVFKDSLACILAKSVEEEDTFSRIFDLYFRQPESSRSPDKHSSDQEETDSPSPNDQQSGQPAQSGAPQAGGMGGLSDLAERGDDTEISLALQQAAEAVGTDDIRFSTQTSYFARRILEQLGVGELEEQLIDRLRDQAPGSQEEAQRLIDARAEMMARARALVEQRFDLFGRGATEDFMEEFLTRKPMSQLDRRDMERMRGVITKMAKRLAAKHSRKKRKRNRGQLDVRRTLRQNAGYDGVPFDISWKLKKRDRPKLVVICDVSGSVAQYVRFLLLLLYSLNEVVPDISSFAFSSRLYDVGDYLDELDFDTAFARILHEAGSGSTDYGQALSDFKVQHWPLIDRRTTIIVLGDGRSNYGDPRLDIFKEAVARAKRSIWLCPEHPGLWGSGDSEILRYRPHCTLSYCSSAQDLERAVDDVLIAYN